MKNNLVKLTPDLIPCLVVAIQMYIGNKSKGYSPTLEGLFEYFKLNISYQRGKLLKGIKDK